MSDVKEVQEVKDDKSITNSQKRQAYREKQEEKRKTLKHVRIDAESVDSEVELPKVSIISCLSSTDLFEY